MLIKHDLVPKLFGLEENYGKAYIIFGGNVSKNLYKIILSRLKLQINCSYGRNSSTSLHYSSKT